MGVLAKKEASYLILWESFTRASKGKLYTHPRIMPPAKCHEVKHSIRTGCSGARGEA